MDLGRLKRLLRPFQAFRQNTLTLGTQSTERMIDSRPDSETPTRRAGQAAASAKVPSRAQLSASGARRGLG